MFYYSLTGSSRGFASSPSPAARALPSHKQGYDCLPKTWRGSADDAEERPRRGLEPTPAPAPAPCWMSRTAAKRPHHGRCPASAHHGQNRATLQVGTPCDSLLYKGEPWPDKRQRAESCLSLASIPLALSSHDASEPSRSGPRAPPLLALPQGRARSGLLDNYSGGRLSSRHCDAGRSPFVLVLWWHPERSGVHPGKRPHVVGCGKPEPVLMSPPSARTYVITRLSFCTIPMRSANQTSWPPWT